MRPVGKTSLKKAPTRRKSLGLRRLFSMKVNCALVLASVLLLLTVLAWQTDFSRRINDVIADAIHLGARHGFSVQEIILHGRHRSTSDEIRRVVGLNRGSPIFAVHPQKIKKRIEHLPWVDTASVHLYLPNKVEIIIKERTPVALWQRNGKLSLIDTTGRVIPGAKIDKFGNLPILLGEEAPRRAALLFDLLSAAGPLSSGVIGANWVGKRRWNLRLTNGLIIKLPEYSPDRALRRLSRLDKRFRLLERDIKTIDLRLPDRMIIKLGTQRALSNQQGAGRRT